ncbi:uracil-DNA glycosylase [Roseomonas sp. CCTCC AB2023176]|uniref:uracil-DNA glycosylase n=1 Tax=Roseomonas sp. CCTCC AB2023176 TaxID=3342640 RepID=UPI0035D5B484
MPVGTPAEESREAAPPRGRPNHAPLADPLQLAARHAMLPGAAHVAPIRALAARIRAATAKPVPEPDPLDGGVNARLLLLLETPGPRVRQDAIVSRDKPGGTGTNLRRFLDGAGIARRDMLLWNAVPWIIHEPGARNRAPRPAEVRDGLAYLPPFLALLSNLCVIVLSGRTAAGAEATVRQCLPDIPVLIMPHPSPTIVCTSPAIGERIEATLAAAAAILRSAE